MINSSQCPVDFILVNENQVRLVAGGVLIISLLYLITGSSFIILFLLIDFGLRALNQGRFSPLSLFGGLIVKAFHLKYKPTDRGPKRFASIIGCTLTLSSFIFFWLGTESAVFFIFLILSIFSFLESVFAFCTGCFLYSLFFKQKDQEYNKG